MKKIFSVISKLFTRGFALFSVLIIAVCLFGLIFQVSDLSSYLIFTFLAFAFALSLSFTVSDFIRNSSVIRNTVRFVLCYISLAAVFFFGGPLSSHLQINGGSNKGFAVLSVSVIFIVIYAVCGLISLLVSFIRKKIENSSEEYESMFDKE